MIEKEEINRIAFDLSCDEPKYVYRLWDSENRRSLIVTGVNLKDFPEETTLLCVEEYPQICLSSLDLIKPESKIYFKSKVRKEIEEQE